MSLDRSPAQRDLAAPPNLLATRLELRPLSDKKIHSLAGSQGPSESAPRRASIERTWQSLEPLLSGLTPHRKDIRWDFGTTNFQPLYFERTSPWIDPADYGCVPAPMISLLSPSATAGYAVLRRRRSLGSCERSSHRPTTVAAAQVTEMSPSCSRSLTRLP